MKCKVEFEFELPEDSSLLKDIAHLPEISSAIDESYQMIRSRLKYVEGLGKEEEYFLSQLMDVLVIDGVDI